MNEKSSLKVECTWSIMKAVYIHYIHLWEAEKPNINKKSSNYITLNKECIGTNILLCNKIESEYFIYMSKCISTSDLVYNTIICIYGFNMLV